jgi:cell division septation protein DedD
MKIARYIGDLLYDYECVVIPGLGGFLTNDKPASIQPNTHHFRPPYKQVMFNAYLKTNDGLLVNYIAREENISYQEAKAQVDKFVYLCDNALKSGKRINFHRVGYLYLNKNEKIIFEQDSSINYNADAFGLSSFVSPAIRRANAEEKLREVIGAGHEKKVSAIKETKKQDRKSAASSSATESRHTKLLATRKKSSYKTQLVFLVTLILAMMVGWGFMNKDRVNAYYDNYSSIIPLFYSQPNAYLINNIDHVPIAKMSSSKLGSWWINLFEKKEAETPVVTVKKEINTLKKPMTAITQVKTKAPLPAVKKAKTMVVSTVSTKISVVTAKPASKAIPKEVAATPETSKQGIATSRFYIIAGAFKDIHNAQNLIRSLKGKGYDALDAGITSHGLHRIAFAAFDSRPLAEKQLLAIRKSENPSAWILVK